MTIENRLSVTPKDIKRIILICKKCRASIGYEPDKWSHVQAKCGNCLNGEMHPAGADYAHLNSLRESLEKIIKDENPFFEVRFEFNHPGE